ncbi:hypothetical protein BDP27DRAFT_1316183 [Rhodocollybia butyracea]|uniref:Uncharacterized protein n=1 Tax=Rhodocollybia butyracea TaxID=206335 RepID=A0A9P5Q3R6_9AGAR|nr:hypothetical protein BDP27DRAFT_1316183 [Rhodocollybia butyracea]
MMRNYVFLVFLIYRVLSYPLEQSFVSPKNRRFGLSPLFGDDSEPTSLLFPLTPLPTNTLATNIAESSTYLSAGGTGHRKSSISLTSTLDDDETNSIIGSLPPLPPPSSISPVLITGNLQWPTASSIAPTASPTHDSLFSSPHEEKEWKVIGIGLVVVASIASMILLTVFFDSWWGFLRDLCGRKREEGLEEMIPDSEEKTWARTLSTEDVGCDRYPAASSLDSLTQVQKPKSPFPYSVTPQPLFQPPSYFRPGNDPHPLEPLFRRPSTRTPVTISPSILPYS